MASHSKFSNSTGKELPPKEQKPRQNTFKPPPKDRASIEVTVDAKSNHLQMLKPLHALGLNGSKDEILLAHSFNKGQIEWFKVGSALNLMATHMKAKVQQ
ncbi:uncharacterized protein LAESUDRAFT_765191 [Laetiporus sulphureus 93-53]|uniref:Uncharacterized protein n=1 Tax=Laetiporus sulphureus 93-53 TaxID=1314785 RepID=A0A165AWL1_9APHY|nr:uncharacterized protein LAESUDRAFT_765191 [Laetiporus sulphureus 93-53]KZS99794.1 hypothetical protein LAESUDRAFT_765191 [Laetiporus sulphureus 93-53]